jgi:hypothetical protein
MKKGEFLLLIDAASIYAAAIFPKRRVKERPTYGQGCRHRQRCKAHCFSLHILPPLSHAYWQKIEPSIFVRFIIMNTHTRATMRAMSKRRRRTRSSDFLPYVMNCKQAVRPRSR